MSIIGQAIMIGGGGSGSCAVELHGVPGEVVYWSDGVNATGVVTLSGTGDAALTLPAGGYTFTFSIGSACTGAIAATIQTGVTNIVNGWGNRFPVYWFGRGFGYTADPANVANATINANNISMSDSGANPTRHYAFGGVAKGNYTIAAAFIDTTGKYNSGMPGARIYGSSVTYTNEQTAGQTGVVVNGAITADSTLGVQYKPNGVNSPGGVVLHALWLE
jgi:hypothetical protein